MALVGGLIWVFTSLRLSEYGSLEKIRLMVESLGPYGPLAFLGLCMAGVFLHIPEIVLIAAGGVVFGGVKGFFLGWAGSVAGSTATFLVARYFLANAFRAVITSRSRRILSLDDRLARNGFLTVLSLRMLLFMAPPLNWAIGVTRVRFRDYFFGSALGVVPCTAVTCYAAESIARAGSFSAVLTTGVILPASLVVSFVVVSGWVAYRYFR
jgi:uncharacterized membrane protein YdjX (TVP38/TMEM64 family)